MKNMILRIPGILFVLFCAQLTLAGATETNDLRPLIYRTENGWSLAIDGDGTGNLSRTGTKNGPREKSAPNAFNYQKLLRTTKNEPLEGHTRLKCFLGNFCAVPIEDVSEFPSILAALSQAQGIFEASASSAMRKLLRKYPLELTHE